MSDVDSKVELDISQAQNDPPKQVTPHADRSDGRPKGQKDKYPRKPRIRMDIRKRRNFLKSLESHGSISRAAADVNIARGTIYLNMEKDSEFARMVNEAKERAYSVIEEYAFKRLQDGETTTIRDNEGNIVQTIHKPAAVALVNRMLDVTEGFAKKEKNVNHLHVHAAGDVSAVNQLAQTLGITIDQDDYDNHRGNNELEVDGEVVDEQDEEAPE